ncbi:YfjL-like protein [Bacillus xiapuensis]|uniref:YfjL-like protein n=1 Tax=Bacillus xiapuensis TaxID=2014075 RepID=UPI0012FD54D8|nr:hypothetical protein [Bacillus xiapuensis]
MKKRKRKVILAGLIILIFLSGFTYSYFKGTPWKKRQVAKELERYLEERYEQSFVLKSTFFNAEERQYGAVFSPKNDQSMAFNAREDGEKQTYSDDYPEGVWQREFQEDIESAVRKNFPNMTDWFVGTAYGQSAELVKGPAIPTYQEAGAYVWVDVMNTGEFYDSAWQWEKIFQLVKAAQQLTPVAEVSVSFDEKQDPNEEAEVYISCMPAEALQVKSVQHAKKACEVTRFE